MWIGTGRGRAGPAAGLALLVSGGSNPEYASWLIEED